MKSQNKNQNKKIQKSRTFYGHDKTVIRHLLVQCGNILVFPDFSVYRQLEKYKQSDSLREELFHILHVNMEIWQYFQRPFDSLFGCFDVDFDQNSGERKKRKKEKNKTKHGKGVRRKKFWLYFSS